MNTKIINRKRNQFIIKENNGILMIYTYRKKNPIIFMNKKINT